ncbi:MAG: hypothetical protein AAF653_07085 [Chloroflexota bacterium]
MKQTLMILAGLLCLLAVPMTHAQDGGLVAYGALVNGELTDELSLVEYTFAGSAGDMVLFTAMPTTRDLFPLLTLQNAAGDVIATSNLEQGLYNRNGATLALRLAAGGTYTLTVGRLQGTGPYTLRVDGLATAENVLPVGEPLLVNLSPENPFQTFQYGGGLLRMNAIDAESGYIAEVFSREGQVGRLYGSIAQDVSILQITETKSRDHEGVTRYTRMWIIIRTARKTVGWKFFVTLDYGVNRWNFDIVSRHAAETDHLCTRNYPWITDTIRIVTIRYGEGTRQGDGTTVPVFFYHITYRYQDLRTVITSIRNTSQG